MQSCVRYIQVNLQHLKSDNEFLSFSVCYPVKLEMSVHKQNVCLTQSVTLLLCELPMQTQRLIVWDAAQMLAALLALCEENPLFIMENTAHSKRVFKFFIQTHIQTFNKWILFAVHLMLSAHCICNYFSSCWLCLNYSIALVCVNIWVLLTKISAT